jgi:hypothetical protein
MSFKLILCLLITILMLKCTPPKRYSKRDFCYRLPAPATEIHFDETEDKRPLYDPRWHELLKELKRIKYETRETGDKIILIVDFKCLRR